MSGEVRRGERREAERERAVAAPVLTFLYATNLAGSFLGGLRCSMPFPGQA